MNKQKGFTIIELIVVVAIIAVLAGIVMVNVTKYIAKSKNAAIKGNLSTIMTNAAVWYDSNSSTYAGFTSNSTYSNAAAQVTSNGGTVTNATKTDGSAFCVCSTTNITTEEPSGTTFCFDTAGYKKATTTACATRCTATTAACTD